MFEKQLQQYLDLGLTPIPIKGKKPLIKWKHWHPTSINALKPYLRGNANWAVRTGGNLAVLDFDSEQSYVDFVSRNIDILIGDYPVVKTGRGYHLWFRPMKPLKSHAYDGVDLKEGRVHAIEIVRPDESVFVGQQGCHQQDADEEWPSQPGDVPQAEQADNRGEVA